MSFRLIKFYNKDTDEWQSVAVCEDKGEKGDKGDPFTYEDFTLEQLEELKGYVFIPSVDEEGNISWTNDGDLDNPATVNIKGPQGEQGDPFTYEDFTPEQLEGLTGPRGYHFTPSINADGVLSWYISDTEDNPEEVTLRGVIKSSEEPDNHSVLWVVEEEDNGNAGRDIVTSNSVNRIEIVDQYPDILEENVLYIKVK